MTLLEAHFALDRALLERHAAGLPAYIEQVDVVECETGTDAMAYVYLTGEPMPLAICFDKPVPFDRHACAEALLYETAKTVH
jgi:hypothetical protein